MRHGGFARAHWCGNEACEAKARDELAVTIRCLPTGYEASGTGPCVICGADGSKGRVVFAKSY